MAAATDAQMQTYCDQQIRPDAERWRACYDSAKSAQATNGDEYARAAGTVAWADARTDGPPHLLQSGNGANPDAVLTHNAFITAFLKIIDGTDVANDAASAAAMRSNWAALMSACVRPAS